VLGGPPPVGYRLADGGPKWEPDHRDDHHDGAQVAMLRDVAGRVLAGEPLSAAYRAQPVIIGSRGRQVTEKQVRAALQLPVTFGLMTARGDGPPRAKTRPGERTVLRQVVDDPPLDPAIRADLTAVFTARKRGGRAVTAEYPFGRLLRCGKCGNQLTGGKNYDRGRETLAYGCRTPHKNVDGVAFPRPCRGVSVPAEAVNGLLRSAVDQWWADMPDWIAPPSEQAERLDDEERKINAKITQIREWVADAVANRDAGLSTQSAYEAARARYAAMMEQANAELARVRQARKDAPAYRPDWSKLTAAEQCEQVADVFVTPIKVAPGNGGPRARTAAQRIKLEPR
jgi:hypothetical protein